jgi:hypothetical protein
MLTYHHHRCQGSRWHWFDSTTAAGQTQPEALLPGTGEVPLTLGESQVTWRAFKDHKGAPLPSPRPEGGGSRRWGKRGCPTPLEHDAKKLALVQKKSICQFTPDFQG